MKGLTRWIAILAAIFALLPLDAQASELLIPGGSIIGLQLSSDTITVVAYDDVLGAPARDAGLKIGDELVKIDDTPIRSTEDVADALTGCEDQVQLTVRRGSKLCRVTVTPTLTDRGPRIGVYLRQGIAGIGTVTFYDPDTHLFGTLGHGVSDSRGTLLQMTRGNAYTAMVESVKKGRSGAPGQLRGTADAALPCGELRRNTPQGVFGISRQGWQGEPIPTGDYGDIHTGEAFIRSTVCGTSPREYCVEILKIYPQSRGDGRNFLLKVTDETLLDTTGGIVQGMSGSPLVQDGKLIGAVTHVLVNDPTMGYGIYIGNMLEAAA